VDAERHGLGREHDLAETALEELLDEPLHAGKDSGVMESHPHAEGLEDGLVERRLRDGGAVADGLADDLLDLRLLFPRQERLALGEHRLHGSLAAGAAEDEIDGGQPPARVERVQHHGGIDHAARIPAALVHVAVVLGANQPDGPRTHALVTVDLPGEVRDEVGQRNRAVRMRDGHDGAVHETDPVGDLPHVGHGGGERDEGGVARGIHDDLLPHRAPPLVAHVVTLVEHHRLQTRQPARVEHVSEDLGGHHQDRGARVHLHVTGEDAHVVGAELAAEVGELLIAERLQRRRVGEAAAVGERTMDGELGHQGLPRPRRRRDDDGLALIDRPDGAQLEIVQGERVMGQEGFEQVFRGDGRPLAVAVPRYHTTAMRLTGKIALITNVSHFMGPALTEEFAREGATLALHDRSPAMAAPIVAVAERQGPNHAGSQRRSRRAGRGRPGGGGGRRALRPARCPR
jgi:hypothetical protein